MSSGSEEVVSSKRLRSARVRNARRRIVQDSDSDDAPKTLQTKPSKGVWQIVLNGNGTWGEAHISEKGSYLHKAGATHGNPFQIAGGGTSKAPFSIGAAVMVASEAKRYVWRWPNGDQSVWSQIAQEVPDIKECEEMLHDRSDDLKRPRRKKLTKHNDEENESNVANLPCARREDTLANSDGESEDDIKRKRSIPKRRALRDESPDLIAVAASKRRRRQAAAQPTASGEIHDEAGSDAEAEISQPGVRGDGMDNLAESDGESSGSDWLPPGHMETESRDCERTSGLPDVTQDADVEDWQRDLDTRRAVSTAPRSSFSLAKCSRKDIRHLKESSFLGGRPIFDSDGCVNVQLLRTAYREIALKPEIAHQDRSARHILWLASLAIVFGFLKPDLPTRSKRSTKKNSKQQRSPDRVCLHADDFELRFPVRAAAGKKQEGNVEEGEEFFSDGEDPVEQFKRRRKTVMQLVEKSKASQAKITSHSSHNVNLEDMCKTITAPSLSFDWQATKAGDSGDEAEDTLEVCIPENEPNRNSRRDLFKDHIQRQVSRRLAERLLPKQSTDSFQATETSPKKLQRLLKGASRPEKEEDVMDIEKHVEEDDEDEGGVVVASRRRKRVIVGEDEDDDAEQKLEAHESPEPQASTSSQTVKVKGSVFTRPHTVGDFKWMIENDVYPKGLYVFNDNTDDHFSARPGGGNAIIRSFNRHGLKNQTAKSAGICTGYLGRGFECLSSEAKTIIDRDIGEIRALLATCNYEHLIYSAVEGNLDLLGTGIFEVGLDVRRYIVKQLKQFDGCSPSELQANEDTKDEQKIQPQIAEDDIPSTISAGTQAAEKASENTESEIARKSKWPAWVMKLQAAGVVNSNIPRTVSLAQTEPGKALKDAPQLAKRVGSRKEEKKLKQTLLLDMFKKTFSGTLPGNAAAACDEPENSTGEPKEGVASVPPESVPTVWTAALEGAFPALRRLRRLKHIAPEAEPFCLKSESEEEISSEEISDSDGSCSEEENAEQIDECENIESDAGENDRHEGKEELVQSEEIVLSEEDYRRHREMMRLKRQKARKLKRKLRWEVEDIAEIRDEVERMISFGMATMTEEDQTRWRDLVGTAFIDVPSVTTVQQPLSRRGRATSNTVAPPVDPPDKALQTATVDANVTLPSGARRLFGGRANDEGNDLYMVAPPVRQRASFLKIAVQQKQASSSTPVLLENDEDKDLTLGDNGTFRILQGGFHQQELARRLDGEP